VDVDLQMQSAELVETGKEPVCSKGSHRAGDALERIPDRGYIGLAFVGQKLAAVHSTEEF